MPFGVSIYQSLTPLGIEHNLVHKLNIRLTKHSALVDPFLKLK
jgi:hypothetical protein